MYYSTHLIAGATVGSLTHDPVSGFVAGLLSHALLDIIPHHDHKKPTYCFVEILAGTVAFALLTRQFHFPGQVIWGAVGGAIPDIEVVLKYYKIFPFTVFPCHEGWLPHLRARKPWGVLTQIIIIGFGIAILV